MDTMEFEIIKHFGVLDTYQTGWTKELNLVCWNGGEPKFDIRDWNEDHTRMTRGVTLTEKEFTGLIKVLLRMV